MKTYLKFGTVYFSMASVYTRPKMVKKREKKGKILREFKYQVGTSNKAIDALIKAKLPGKRESKSGKIYWESRANRSDKKNKKI